MVKLLHFCATIFLEALLDNYNKDESKEERTNEEKLEEEAKFLNATAVAGGSVDVAYKYLKGEGKTTAEVRLEPCTLLSLSNLMSCRHILIIPAGTIFVTSYCRQ